MPFHSRPLEEIRDQQRELLRRFDPLVGSQEKVREKLGLIESHLAESNEILGTLGSLFVEELAPVVAWLEVIGDRLLEVQRAIGAPRRTAAQELRDHAFRELRKAKIQTAEEDREELINRAYGYLTESIEKLKGDFTVEFALGVMELYERGEPDRAAEYLRLAAIDAKGISPYDCAMSYLFLSFAHISAGRPVEAEKASGEAARAEPNHPMVHYIHAEQCAVIGRTQDALESLGRSFRLEEEHYWRGQAPSPVLFWRAPDDGAFTAIRSDVEALCRVLLDDARATGRRRSLVCALDQGVSP
ncbi:MAG: tetratricopeptide repeat protein [Vicinamibacteria bacterium]